MAMKRLDVGELLKKEKQPRALLSVSLPPDYAAKLDRLCAANSVGKHKLAAALLKAALDATPEP